ncbi:MAG: tRNA (adenosine(37)-N6)-dimethylallyltransferase MiaA [bacterium]|nr:tRNA (adenosine(37)-N6)-dimethylallyltransferase MiaA [bacterium]
MQPELPKLIALLGPTASGKSSLGIQLARECNGEVASADSRQVYRGLDIGTGKVTQAQQSLIAHHLLDVVEPGSNFSVSAFQELAFGVIDDILERNKLPVLVGGTALYAYAVIDNYQFVDVPENAELRAKLAALPLDRLQAMVPKKALNKDDYQNPRRLVRAIEKLKAGAPLKPTKGPTRYKPLIIGMNLPTEELYARIDKRVDERARGGMIEEVQALREAGISDAWLLGLGLEYKWVTEHLQGAYGRDEMLNRLKGAIHAFARRQMTWFKRDKRIVWVRNAREAENEARSFLEEKKKV